VWRLLLNRIPTKDNLARRGIVSSDDRHYVGVVVWMRRGATYSLDVIIFVRCNHFGRIWNMVAAWLGFEFVGNGLLQEQQIIFVL